MTEQEANYMLHIGQNLGRVPELYGEITEEARNHILSMKQVPPTEGYIMASRGVPGNIPSNIDDRIRQMLVGFRGVFLSEIISIEYLLAAVPLTHKLNNEKDFHLKFWENIKKSSTMMSGKLNFFKEWVRSNSIYLKSNYETFTKASDNLLETRNSLAHYPLSGLSNKAKNMLTPFVYYASKDKTIVFDSIKMMQLDHDLGAVKGELIAQRDKLRPIKVV